MYILFTLKRLFSNNVFLFIPLMYFVSYTASLNVLPSCQNLNRLAFNKRSEFMAPCWTFSRIDFQVVEDDASASLQPGS